MADYYPLIARAVAGLEPGTPGEVRRALYERARSALIAQLRAVQPALSEAEITRERLALEEAVRKVEQQTVQRARGELARNDPRPQNVLPGVQREPVRTAPPAPRAGDALRAAAARTVSPGMMREGGPASAERPPRNLRADFPVPPRQTPPPRDLRDTRMQDGFDSPRRDAHPAPSESSRSNGIRDIVADADQLGRSARQANRSARETYSKVPGPTPEFDRLEPELGDQGSEPFSYDDGFEQQPEPPPRKVRKKERVVVPEKSQRERGGFPIKSAIAIGVILMLVGGGILGYQKLGPSIRSAFSSLFKSTPVADTSKDAAGTRPKITDRVGQPGSASQVAPIAQRAVLYDEDASDPQGKQYVGSVIWRVEPIKGSGGQQDWAVRADVDIPDRKFKMSMSIRRNSDASLPASHTAELSFLLPPDFAGGTVANVPGILMRTNEQQRGTPLAGLAVKVTDGFFLVGLSNVDADKQRNMQLLKERSAFDIPLVYTNQKRAIIALEKGAPGERAFTEAFSVWGQ